MNAKILLIMPTRGRPWSALEAIASVMKTADNPEDVAICVCCDRDDPGVINLSVGGLPSSFPIHCYHSHKRTRFVEAVNNIVKANITSNVMDYPWCRVGWLADDIRFRTKGWDTILRTHSELVVYGYDGYQNAMMPTHPFVLPALPKALGFFLPAELAHSCPDLFIQEIGKACGSIVYNSAIVTEHLHPDAGKAEWDQTYKDSREFYEADHKAYQEKVLPRIGEYAERVRNYLTNEPTA
jgi:hypothetical protein